MYRSIYYDTMPDDDTLYMIMNSNYSKERVDGVMIMNKFTYWRKWRETLYTGYNNKEYRGFMSKADLQKWAKATGKSLDEIRQEQLEELGYKTLWKPPVGSSTVEIDVNEEPRDIKSQYGASTVFRIKVGGKVLDWAVNHRSPVLREIVNNIAEGHTKFEIVRTGKGQSTRYTVIPK